MVMVLLLSRGSRVGRGKGSGEGGRAGRGGEIGNPSPPPLSELRVHLCHNADRRSLRGLVGRYWARWKEILPDYGNRVVRSGPSRWACCPLAAKKVKPPIYCGILTPHRPMIIITQSRWAQTFQPRSPFRPVSVGLMSISHPPFPIPRWRRGVQRAFPHGRPRLPIGAHRLKNLTASLLKLR